ncbi:unnamed protein product [Caenorhabditis brenneri]
MLIARLVDGNDRYWVKGIVRITQNDFLWYLTPIKRTLIVRWRIERKTHYHLPAWSHYCCDKINPKRLAFRGFTDKDIGLVHVLTDDVLESGPISMERQQKEPESYAGKLADFEKKWKVEDANMTRSIKVEGFENMMNEFEVDKSLIVIGPDVQSYFSSMRTVYYGTGPITTYNYDRDLIITAHQAVFHVFQSTIFGYNRHELKKNPYNHGGYKEVLGYETEPPGNLVTC